VEGGGRDQKEKDQYSKTDERKKGEEEREGSSLKKKGRLTKRTRNERCPKGIRNKQTRSNKPM